MYKLHQEEWKKQTIYHDLYFFQLWVSMLLEHQVWMISIVANFSEKLPVLFFFLLLSVATANLSCLLETTFSSLRFLFNFTSLQSLESGQRFHFRVLSSILSLSFLCSSVSEALFTLSFSYLSECFFFVHDKAWVSQVSLYHPKMTLSMRVGYVIPPMQLIWHTRHTDIYTYIYIQVTEKPFTSGLKLTDCTNVVASKYFRWQDLCQAVGG